MKTFRKIIFWLHLTAGVFAGIVVLIMSLTGVLLTYEKQMLLWADTRGYQSAPPSPDARRLPIEDLIDKIHESRSAWPSTVTIRSDLTMPVAFAFGRESTAYANPYTGELLGEGSSGMRSFFRVVTDWHRWLGAGADNREVGKAITGGCNLAFLFIVMSGFYLWWPRSWRWPNVKSVILFRGGLPAKARNFNWHNVIGFWSAIPLFWVVLSATIISYPWASNLVYQIVGEEAPARGGPGGRGPGGPGRPQSQPSADARGAGRAAASTVDSPQRAESRAGRGDGPRASGAQPLPERAAEAGPGPRGGERGSRGAPDTPPTDLNLAGLGGLFERAQLQAPAWKAISLRMPSSNDEPLSFAIDEGMGGQPHLRSTLTLDRSTGEVVSWETFADASLGWRLRSLLRFVHTGEAGGFLGQTIAGLVSAGAVVLVYTGLALTLRRFRGWIARRRLRQEHPDEDKEEESEVLVSSVAGGGRGSR